MKKIHLDLPQTAVVNVLQRGSDLVLILTNGEERIVRDVYEGGEPAAEVQLAFSDGAVLAVSGAGLGESLSTSEVISTKTGDAGLSDPMVGPATATAMVPSFLSTEEGQAAAAGLFGLLGLVLISSDNDNDSNPNRPDAMDDVSTVDAGQTVEIDVLANDVNSQGVVGGEGLEFEILSQPSNGSAEVLTLISDPTDEAAARGEMGTTEQTVLFTADPDGSGPGEFTYRVTDLKTGETDTATVTVDVTSSPLVLDAVDDTSSADLNQRQFIDVLANDVLGSGSVTIAPLAEPEHGTVRLLGDGRTFEYTPDENYFGSDSFTYTVTDPETGETDTATVRVTVDPVSPDAMNDTFSVEAGQSRTIDVLANDEEGVPDNRDIFVSDVEQPANGTVDIAADGKSVVYTPDAGFEGDDPFDYTITETETNLSDTATATAIVSVTPPPPDAMDDSSSGGLNQTQTINVLGNDVPGVGTLTITSFDQPANGTVVLSDDGQGFVYTPNANYFGSDDFEYTVTDSETGETDIATVTVDVVAPAPDAMDDISGGAVGQTQTIDVLANDEEGVPGNSDLSISGIEQQPVNGTAEIQNGQLVYTPNAGFDGNDVIEYTITEAETGKMDTARVMVTVSDNADAMDDSSSGGLNQTQTINVLDNDFPGSGDLTIESVTMPQNGTVVISEDRRSLEYTPNANYFGPDELSYTVTNGSSQDTADVTIEVVPPAPNAMDDTSSGAAGQTQTIDVLANDEEGVPDNGDISISSFEQPANGTVTNENGQLVYTPNDGFEGTDRIAYTITETETNLTDTAFVDVTVGDPGLLDFALADGGLLGEVTGNSGLLGDITGSDGVLGDLLGTGGTLGDVGGAEGVVGDLTGLTLLGDGSGDDAILDPLVADEGALGELTGDNGLLADVSGASGLVGDLATNSGALGDVTGIDGLVGDLTGRDTLSEPTGDDVNAGDGGLLDGVLGGGEGDTGLLDGVLGGGEGDTGLLDGVLGGDGGDGLLDGLLGGDDTLLGGLTGALDEAAAI